jgi:proteic killer suppression protein
VIASFGDKATGDVFHGLRTRETRALPPDVVRIARRKLDMLNAAHLLTDLRAPPGNRLEALRGDLSGLHSVRVNDQWRIVFRWRAGHAEEVRVVDYHRG